MAKMSERQTRFQKHSCPNKDEGRWILAIQIPAYKYCPVCGAGLESTEASYTELYCLDCGHHLGPKCPVDLDEIPKHCPYCGVALES